MAARKSIPLRIHPRLYDAVRQWAEDDFRSVNGQIEWLCHQALLRAGRLPKSLAADRREQSDDGADRPDIGDDK
jgi:hypothetical protein